MIKIFFFIIFPLSYCFGFSNNLTEERFAKKVGDGDSSLLSRRGEFIPPVEIFDIEELNQQKVFLLKNQREDLKKIKYYLLNGQLRKAAVYLIKFAQVNNKFKPIIYRYLSTIFFLQGDFAESLKYLQLKELLYYPHYSKVCVLNIVNRIILDETKNLEALWNRCKIENTDFINQNSVRWLEALITLKLQPYYGVTKIPFKGVELSYLNNEELKTLLKMTIYFNQEEFVLKEIQKFELEQLKDPEIRELIGQIYFRSGIFSKSYEYIEDLKTPNSESIKGNLYILRGKYELAYSQFKLALEKKINSKNAIERLLPLGWTLKDWQYGSELAHSMVVAPDKYIEKMTLLSAFYIQSGELEKSNKTVQTIYEKSKKWDRPEVTQQAGFLGLMLSDTPQMKKNATLSCENLDLNFCWLLMQTHYWESLHLLVRKEGDIKHQNITEELTKEVISKPIKEKIYVNQRDIEELDEKADIEERIKKAKTGA